MSEDLAAYYRRQAEKCLDQAELAPEEFMKARLRYLAGEWLKMADSAALLTGR